MIVVEAIGVPELVRALRLSLIVINLASVPPEMIFIIILEIILSVIAKNVVELHPH